MDYLSTTQIAKLWDVSRKTVLRYATDGRIEGAYLVGNTWMIPADARKPSAEAFISKNGDKTHTPKTDDETQTGSNFHFPLYLYRDFFRLKDTLTKPEELKLYSSFEAALNGNYDEAYILADEALSVTDDIPIKITCLYMMARCSLLENKYNLFTKHTLEMNLIFAEDFEHKKEMSLLLIDLETYFKGFDSLLNASFDLNSGFGSEMFPIVTTMSLYKHILGSFDNKNEIDTAMYEMSLKLFKEMGYIYPSIMLASELAVIFYNKKQTDVSYKYAKYAYDLALENNGFFMLTDLYSAAPKVLDKALKHYRTPIDPALVSMARASKKSYAGLMFYLKKPRSLFSLINDDYDYIYYAVNNYTNKQIAIDKKISENAVSQKYRRLYRAFNAENKKELVSSFLESLSEY
ncbi:MAG: hypothetical protein J6Y89_04470 [Lachnospiraceae bacterium]|nr:hypothetical protein [Lachnospiraceae bacterium]